MCQLDQAQFILVHTGSIYAVRSFSSCGKERAFLYLDKMTVHILGMCISFSVRLWYSMNLRHQTVWTIFSYLGDVEAIWL